jgi:hypothetical protein
MTQHATLSPERWSSFSLNQQILMIGNEMNRAGKMQVAEHHAPRRDSYERILNLTDLTIRVQNRPGLRRELLRWRDLIASLYLEPDAQPVAHAHAFRVLLLMTPEASLQIPYVLA